MKSLWIYVIIGSTAFAVGATGGIIGKRFIAAAKTQYIGEIETMDIEDLMKRYNQNPNQNFTPAEMVNIAMEKYRNSENCYSVSKGTANTVVNQTIRNYQIKNGDDYFEESISRSSMVKLADRMTQHGKEGDIKFYHGKADSEEVGSYPSDPKVYSQEDYTNFLGRTLNQMFIYVITDNTVLDDGTKVEKTKDGYKLTLALDPDVSTYYYKTQMYNISGLDALPTFEYVTLTYSITSDYMLEHLSVDEKYKATMGISVDIRNSLETDYYPNAYKAIPALDEPLIYSMRGE